MEYSLNPLLKSNTRRMSVSESNSTTEYNEYLSKERRHFRHITASLNHRSVPLVKCPNGPSERINVDLPSNPPSDRVAARKKEGDGDAPQVRSVSRAGRVVDGVV